MTEISRRVDDWGRVIFQGGDALEILLSGGDITGLLIEPSATVMQYNTECVRHNKSEFCIGAMPEPEGAAADVIARRRNTWLVPERYKNLPVRQIVIDRCTSDPERQRVNQEMDLFEEHGWIPILRLMFYLVDHFRERKVVWGVGRGSSVASYVLFLIGVHKINSLEYELDIREFLKNE